jgi:hypothetical protein
VKKELIHMGVAEATLGDRRAVLVALRDKLAADVDDAAVQYVAALARQLQSVLSELDSLPDAEAVSLVDDLKAKRAKRRAAATDKPRPVGGDKRGTRGGGARSGGGASS